MKKQFVAAGFILFSFMLPLKATAAQIFSGMYVFGDSLSDTGNVFNNTLDLFPQTGVVIPPPPYFQGRFSDGPIWIDELAKKLKFDNSPTLYTNVAKGATPTNGINFAFGGATTTDANTIALTFFPPELRGGLWGLQQQIEAFTNPLKTNNQFADPNALYILWAGANDYNPTQGSFQPFTQPDITLGNLSNALKSLAEVGVKNVVVPNLPNLGITPVALELEQLIPGTSERLNNLTQAHNTGLSNLLQELNQNPSLGLDIISLDVNSLFSDPQALGFTNVAIPCLGTLEGCKDTDFFADMQHPTTAAHKILGDYAYQQITKSAKPVPEPSTALGTLAIGAWGAAAVLKRKRKQPLLTTANRVPGGQLIHTKVES